MKILITGVAGFIGSNLARQLSRNNKHTIFGIDNFDNYTSRKIQNLRLKDLKEKKNFKFIKIDLRNSNNLKKLFKKNNFDYVYHLAASVGVRYSLINPEKYIFNNVVGFFNLLESVKIYPPKCTFFASSSSVYGESKDFPLLEKANLNPINIYSYSKKSNEEMAVIYSKMYNLNFIGLRFFTVFGEWGRPDMFFLKLLNSIFLKKIFYLNNNGFHYRDFTYVGDVVKILEKMLFIKKNKKFDIFNICSNKPYKLSFVINYVFAKLGRTVVKNISLNKADVIKTHGSNNKVKKILKYKNFTPIKTSIDSTINWFQKHKKIFI